MLKSSTGNERVASCRGKALTVVCAYVLNNSSENLAFLKSLGGVLKTIPIKDTHVGLTITNTIFGQNGGL